LNTVNATGEFILQIAEQQLSKLAVGHQKSRGLSEESPNAAFAEFLLSGGAWSIGMR
jgi:hypothetical protein